ncbi:MAG: HAMP domain-containing protein [Cyanobacteria bacterium P01_A01_bin.45]
MKDKTVSSYKNGESAKNTDRNDISIDQATLLQRKPNSRRVNYHSDRYDHSGAKLSLWQRFSNLPISNKQLIALVASEMVGILGIGIVGMFLVTNKLQSLSLEQAKSEVGVTDIAYNIKIDQMGFGFRGQSDNTALIQAAKLHAAGQILDAGLQGQVKQILQNEVTARKIEYATLVGKDLKIIANANSNRQGEIWNPDNLITEVLKNPRQIKASRVISWSELQRESSPLPNGFKGQNALIRYTVTPIKDPTTNQVNGALVSGDIVNGKNTILNDTLRSTGGGYSAIYMLQPTGKYSLVTSLKLDNSQDISDADSNIGISQESQYLLEQAAVAQGKPITARIKVGNYSYAMAFQGIPSKIYDAYDAPVYDPKKGRIKLFGQKSVAILVRGTPETALNQLLKESFWVEIITISLAWIIMLIWAIILRKSIIKPIEHLRSVAGKFASGDRTIRAEIFAIDEVGQLAASFNQMADQISDRSENEARKAKLIEVAQKISSLSSAPFDLNQILRVTVTDIKEAIKADRVMVYRFQNQKEGKVIASSASNEWSTTLGSQTKTPNFAEYYLPNHSIDTPLAIENIYLTNFNKSQIALLSEFAVKALLMVPILIDSKLYGFLIAQQCSSPRKWQDSEINLLQQVTTPLGYALDKAWLVEELDKYRQDVVTLQEGQHKQEVLQGQLKKLIEDIQSVSRGDLTVKAEVVPGEVGVIAEHFNYAIANLREVIDLLRLSITDFNRTIERNQSLVDSFAEHDSEQFEQIIPLTMEMVDNTQKAAEVAVHTSGTAEKSAIAVNTIAQDMSHLYLSITQTGQKVERLRNTATDVSNMVSSIKEIATHTHLLAINLGLEAARNTDSAEDDLLTNTELGELALRCANATKDMEESLEAIQEGTKDVVKDIQQQIHQTLEIRKLTENSQVSLNQIHHFSEELSGLVDSISQISASQLDTLHTGEEFISEVAVQNKLSVRYSQRFSESLMNALEVFKKLEESVDKFKTK